MQISKIEYNKPFLGIEEANIASSIIESGWIAKGNKTKEFEDNICDYQVAETLAESTLSIPIYPARKDVEFNYLIRL